MTTENPLALLGCSPTSAIMTEYLAAIAKEASLDSVPSPVVKAYPDALYANYYSLGLSFMFVSKYGSKSLREADVNGDTVKLDSIDVFNALEDETKKTASGAPTAQTFSTYPALLALPLAQASTTNEKGDTRASQLRLSPTSNGQNIVSCLGEPDRKGGGAGPSSGSIGIWCEWSKDGIMIEFGGDSSRGPQAWERGKDAKWKVLTLFTPKT